MKPEILYVCSKLMYRLDHCSSLSSSLSRPTFHLFRRPRPLGAAAFSPITSSSEVESASVLTSVAGNLCFHIAVPYWSTSISRSVLCPCNVSTGGAAYIRNLSYSGVRSPKTGSIFRLFSNSPLNFCPGNQGIVESGNCGPTDGGEGFCSPIVNTGSEPNPQYANIKDTIDVIAKNQSDTDSIRDVLCEKQNAVELTKNKLADYKLWIRERDRFEQSRDMIAELRRIGLELDLTIYNHLISYFCKYGAPEEARSIMGEMIKSGLSPNALTYDILICHFCTAEYMECAIRLYELMICDGIEPRFSTNRAIIKGYFDSEQYLTAHNFVIDANVILRSSANQNYSLLASLHQRKGNLFVAYNILLEMMGKGLKPDNGVYGRVLRRLIFRRMDFANTLISRFNRLVNK